MKKQHASIYRVCDDFLNQEHGIPTLDFIVQIHKGSKSTAKEARDAWLADLGRRVDLVKGMPDLPHEAAKAVTTFWAVLTKANQETFDARNSAVDRVLKQSEEDVQEAEKARDTAIEAEKAMLARAELAEAEIRKLERALEKETGRREEIEARIQRADDAVTEIKREAEATVAAHLKSIELAEGRELDTERRLSATIGELKDQNKVLASEKREALKVSKDLQAQLNKALAAHEKERDKLQSTINESRTGHESLKIKIVEANSALIAAKDKQTQAEQQLYLVNGQLSEEREAASHTRDALSRANEKNKVLTETNKKLFKSLGSEKQKPTPTKRSRKNRD